MTPEEAMMPKGWGSKGMAEPGVRVHRVVSLSQAQCDTLAMLSELFRPEQRLLIQQTWSESGNTHLYVLAGETEYHVGRDGKALKMGVK